MGGTNRPGKAQPVAISYPILLLRLDTSTPRRRDAVMRFGQSHTNMTFRLCPSSASLAVVSTSRNVDILVRYRPACSVGTCVGPCRCCCIETFEKAASLLSYLLFGNFLSYSCSRPGSRTGLCTAVPAEADHDRHAPVTEKKSEKEKGGDFEIDSFLRPTGERALGQMMQGQIAWAVAQMA